MLQLINDDCLAALKALPAESVQCCVTSPPYFGLRDYGHDGQIGLELTPAEYVAKLVAVFAEVKRVLKADGLLWLNLGDSYASFRDGKATPDSTRGDDKGTLVPKGSAKNRMAGTFTGTGVKHKDLIGIPWRVAFALQADGWYLRSDIIWHKPNPMPESVTDRCTKAHEYLFMLAKSERYYFDAEAIKDPVAECSIERAKYSFDSSRKRMNSARVGGADYMLANQLVPESGMRNRRTVWTVATSPYKGAHFATFPPDLIKPCILAGCPIGGTVLDPFGGSGTTGMVAIELGRKAVLIELNPDYCALIRERCTTTVGLPLEAA